MHWVLSALLSSYARGKGRVKRNPLISIACAATKRAMKRFARAANTVTNLFCVT